MAPHSFGRRLVIRKYRWFLGASQVLTPLALAIAFGLEQIWIGALAAIGLGAWGWYANQTPNLRSREHYLAGTILILVVGALIDVSPYLLAAALLGALASWDLFRFESRTGFSSHSEGLIEIERRHLAVLGFALLAGGIFAAALLTVRVEIDFWFALLLAIFLIVAFGELFRVFRSGS